MSAEQDTSKAARAMGKRSAQARRDAWGEAEFLHRMKEIGKLGGRPRKNAPTESNLGPLPKPLKSRKSKIKKTESKGGRR